MTVLCVVTVLVAFPTFPSSAQGTTTRYFKETGHSVSGEFLQFYETYGGRAIFGYPLTREFKENDRQVQYFQRVRMELHGQNPEPYRIQLGLLGDELGYHQSPIPVSEIPSPDHSDKRYFAETGHTVAFAFLDFYEKNGGLDIFGYPITEWVIEPNGRIVQYFQRGKMEWYPENPPGQRVQLGMLGTIYVEQYVDPIYIQREDRPIPPSTLSPEVVPTSEPTPVLTVVVSGIRMMSTLKHPIVGLNGKQVVYVYVLDQSGHGVQGASVEVDVQYKSSDPEHFVLGSTNANGHTQIEFPIGNPTPGYVVIVSLSARYGDLTAQTSTAFLPWW
jgi:hypothetical protein